MVTQLPELPITQYFTTPKDNPHPAMFAVMREGVVIQFIKGDAVFVSFEEIIAYAHAAPREQLEEIKPKQVKRGDAVK